MLFCNYLILNLICVDSLPCQKFVLNLLLNYCKLFLGLKTALVEKFDFSSGTSSRSTKLIHGGVRYLQKAILGLDLEQVSRLF